MKNDFTKKNIGFYFLDIISPWAYLFHKEIENKPLNIQLEVYPVLFAGLLKYFGHKGPAEIEKKRIATFELCVWKANEMNIPFLMPKVHPFNPIKYLRLIIAGGCKFEIISIVFDYIWATGNDLNDPNAITDLIKNNNLEINIEDLENQNIKDKLKLNTSNASEIGIFGVPTIMYNDHLFWGLDSAPLLRAKISEDPIFNSFSMKQVHLYQDGLKLKKPL